MPGKRGHGEGSITKRENGKWRVQLMHDGRRVLDKTVRTRKEAQALLDQAKVGVSRGLRYDAAKETLASYMTRWLASKEASLRPKTHADYTFSVKRYVLPELGEIPVAALTADRVQYVWDTYLVDGVGAPSIRKAHDVLHAALNKAVKTGQVIRNVLDLVEKPAASDTEMEIWSEAEAMQFLAAARENRLYGLFYLALVTGMRQMELCGLQWSDIDWATGGLHVQRQLTRVGPNMYAAPKSKSGRRTLTLGQGTISVLQDHLERQADEKLLAGSGWTDHGLVFTTSTGTPMRPENLVDRYYTPLVEKAGVDRIRFHDLRHTAASLMLGHRRPILEVSYILGHSRVSITLDVYGHLIPGADADAIKLMEKIVTPAELAVEDLPL
jgi:integrase